MIGKDLTLHGAGAGATLVRSPAALTPYAVGLSGDPFYAIVRVVHGAHVRMSGLTVSRPDPSGTVSGVVALQAANLELTGNTVSGGVCTIPGCGPDPTSEIQAAGIIVDSSVPGSTVAGNHVSGSDIGVYDIFSPDCCKISGNTLTDNRYFGILIQDGNGETRDNTISGGQVGIGVAADAVDTFGVLRGDSITGTTVAPVREIECCGFTATAIVK